MIVAIHQPNFFPWLGYFKKMAEADAFIFLDDAQFSKGSYTNRTRIMSAGARRWLTVPVSVQLGQAINEVRIANDGWKRSHLDILRQTYRSSPCFAEVFACIEGAFSAVATANLAEINLDLVEAIANRLGIRTETRLASELDADGLADDRLISLLRKTGENCVYLSGEGGAKYQSESKFATAGIEVRYLSFQHPRYLQTSGGEFLPGLSVLDAAFNLGWEGTARLLSTAKSG